MTVRFAPARTPARSPLARAFARPAIWTAANDNGGEDSRLLRAALQHFAKHGLNAARAAREEAERAFATGNHSGAEGWAEICNAFDRRLGARLKRHMSVQGTQPATYSR
jgi:hypothetical protein